jgi:hypothetical protein
MKGGTRGRASKYQSATYKAVGDFSSTAICGKEEQEKSSYS